MAVQLPALPYDRSALAPHISEETLNFHYGKHHQAYVTNLNKLIEGTDLDAKSLDDVIMAVVDNPDKAGVFNNAAQVWNHTFYWHSMKPHGGGKPQGDLWDHIVRDFGSYENFVEEFKKAGATQFGSGWAWLVMNKDGGLEIMKTANADLPMAHGKKAILTCDVWEHAYYLDYQNRRPDYLSVFLEHLVNWDFAEANYEAA